MLSAFAMNVCFCRMPRACLAAGHATNTRKIRASRERLITGFVVQWLSGTTQTRQKTLEGS